MNTFTIPYALADSSYTQFKEINAAEYERLNKIISELKQLQNMKFTDTISTYELEQAAREDVMKKHKNAEYLYKLATKELSDFEKKHFNVFCEERILKDEDTFRFLWIFDLSNRTKDLERHYKKYKHLYTKKEELRQKILELKPYLRENLTKTIEQKQWEATYKIKERNARKKNEWENNIRTKYKNLTTSFGGAAKYTYICKNLSMSVNGTTCTISCLMTNIQNYNTEYINRTFINKAIQIIR